MAKFPSFPLYAQDFDMDTNTWSNEEVGVYLRLLLSEWINGPLPDDTKKLAQIARISPKKFKNLFQICSKKFIRDGNGFLINEKMEKIREKVSKWLEQKQKAGIAGARKRWKNDNGRYNTRLTDAITDPIAKTYQPKSNINNSLSSDTNVSSDKQPSAVSSKKKSGHFSEKINEDIVIKINDMCEKIKTNKTLQEKKFSGWKFAQKNCIAHPQAILHVLEQIAKQGDVIKSPWAYANKVLHIESQNYNERETVQAHKIMKRLFMTIFGKDYEKNEY
jgi:uncharacterized protein YdaU (DUF1376 family)